MKIVFDQSLVRLLLLFYTFHFTHETYGLGDRSIKTDTLLIHDLNEKAFALRSKNPDSTLILADSAYRMSSELNYTKGISRSLYSIGVGYHMKGKFDTTYTIYNQAIPLAKQAGDLHTLSRLYNNLGLIQWNRGHYSEAIDFHRQSLNIGEKLQDKSRQVTSLNNIGLIYKAMNDNAQALEYYRRSFLILQDLNDSLRMNQLLNNIGQIWGGSLFYDSANQEMAEGDIAYDSAIWYYKQSLKYAESDNYICYRAHPFIGMANMMMKIDQFDSVIFYAEQSYRDSKKCGIPKIQAVALNAIGNAYEHMGRSKAEFYLKEALELANKIGILEVQKSSALGLANYYHRIGNYKLALEYHQLYEEKRYKLIDKDQIRKIAQVEAAHQTEKEQQVLILAQEKERARLNAKVEKEATIRNYMLIGFIFFIIISLIVYLIYRREKILSATLRQKNEKIGQLKHHQDALTHMIAHDLRNALSTVLDASEGQQEQRMKRIHQSGNFAVNLLTNMLDILRFEESSMMLKPKPQRLIDLLEEAQTHLKHFIEAKNLQIVIDVSDRLILEADQNVMVRVLFNLLHNAIKYSSAEQKIHIKTQLLNERDPTASLVIKDFGSGIAPKDLPYVFDKYRHTTTKFSGFSSSMGLGLTFCKMAIEAHGDAITVDSEKEKWTAFSIHFHKVELLPKEHQQRVKNIVQRFKDKTLNDQERNLLNELLPNLSNVKVYQASKLESYIDRMEEVTINKDWLQQLRTAIHQCDQKLLDATLAELS